MIQKIKEKKRLNNGIMIVVDGEMSRTTNHVNLWNKDHKVKMAYVKNGTTILVIEE